MGTDPGRNGVEIRSATPADAEAVLALLQRVVPDDTGRAEERWRWLFLERLADTRMHYLVVESDDRLVGQIVGVPFDLQHDGHTVLGLLAIDLVVDQDFQGRGLFTALTHHLYETTTDVAPIIYGFPNVNSAGAFYRKFAWVELRPFPMFIRPLPAWRQVVANLRPSLAGVARAGEILTPVMRGFDRALLASGGGSASVERFDRFGDWADELWELLATDLGTCVVRDAAYLNWRYVAAPYEYRRYALRREGRITGFAVTGVQPSRLGHLELLMELLAPPDDRAGARLLLAHALRDAARHGAAGMSAIATGRHPHRRAIRQAGFVPAPPALKANSSFGVHQNSPAAVPNRLFHIDDWFISGADFDTI